MAVKQGLMDWKEISDELDREFGCPHSETEVRKQVFSNNSVHYRPQCLRCGEGMQLITKASLTPEQARALKEFDTGLRDDWVRRTDDRRKEYYVAREREWRRQKPDRQREYRESLNDPEWQRKRALVLKRDKYLCQGCLVAPATDVHHLTYEHRGAEFLFELIGVCRPCHVRLHPEEHQDDEQFDGDDEA